MQSVCQLLTAHNIKFFCNYAVSGSALSAERNQLYAQFLKSDYEFLFWIDADEAFAEIENFLEVYLLCKEVKVVAGLSPTRPHNSNFWAVTFAKDKKENFVRHPQHPKLIKAESIGMAFFMMYRGICERVVQKNPHRLYTDRKYGKCHDLFSSERIGEAYLREDQRFCKHLIDAGVDIWVYPDLTFCHTGMHSRVGNYENFLKEARNV